MAPNRRASKDKKSKVSKNVLENESTDREHEGSGPMPAPAPVVKRKRGRPPGRRFEDGNADDEDDAPPAKVKI
ncbi:hypothetical protein GALMADRAFT_149173 [Galerina marginata CBS 339.88]|uniref:Uncharacterized protein n=1 Tax=Galerina marginata (strain CBS 339.88) TaxID=685588 RepID=A0A067SAU8_GALM3|nr:hypothetical protein GALMADRAFT_149173 [Galerina marginata CBS 339.88]